MHNVNSWLTFNPVQFTLDIDNINRYQAKRGAKPDL